jgi:hypothetical protein
MIVLLSSMNVTVGHAPVSPLTDPPMPVFALDGPAALNPLPDSDVSGEAASGAPLGSLHASREATRAMASVIGRRMDCRS